MRGGASGIRNHGMVSCLEVFTNIKHRRTTDKQIALFLSVIFKDWETIFFIV
jgi:hypothetical protein